MATRLCSALLFVTIAIALAACFVDAGDHLDKKKKHQPSLCRLPAKTGRCKAYIERYHFDKKSGKCRKFIYGGCDGNENNFETLKQCQAKCMGRTTKPSHYRHKKPSFCKLGPKRGPCHGRLKRYFFDHQHGRCRSFFYGGCYGNRNNFRSLKECRAICHHRRSIPEKKQKPTFCRLAKDPGPCRASMPRYYFDEEKGECKRFIYGGCQGNKNNFKTLKECEQTCPPEGESCSVESSSEENRQRPSLCNLKPKKGQCKGHMARYFFDPETHKCHKFIYGGCHGNENNFRTSAMCMMVCGSKKKGNRKNRLRDSGSDELLGAAQPGMAPTPTTTPTPTSAVTPNTTTVMSSTRTSSTLSTQKPLKSGGKKYERGG